MRLPNPALGELLAAERPQVCIHCAGRASVPQSMKDPAPDFRDNTALTFELLNLLRQYVPGCRFLLLSSAAVYGNPRSLPVGEGDEVRPVSPYGFHKRQCELLCQEFSSIYGVPTASVRISVSAFSWVRSWFYTAPEWKAATSFMPSMSRGRFRF
jgi:UDP-glucose 4-epimerase